MHREQVKPFPKEHNSTDQSRLGPDEKQDINDIVEMISLNFSRALADIMSAQERRRRVRS